MHIAGNGACDTLTVIPSSPQAQDGVAQLGGRLQIQWLDATRPGAATFGGNLVSCAAALATLAFHKREKLGERSANLGERLLQQLKELQSRRPEIAEVRGRGLMIGVELRDVAQKTAAERTDEILERLKYAGFLVGKTGPGRNVITLMPPLIVEAEELGRMVEAIDQSLRLP